MPVSMPESVAASFPPSPVDPELLVVDPELLPEELALLVDPTGRTLAEGRGELGLVVGDVDALLARELQQKIPVRRDLRPDVYGARPGAAVEP